MANAEISRSAAIRCSDWLGDLWAARKGFKMAYFPNGTSGMCFDEQCSRCKYGEGPCPIALVQTHYNYDACNNKVAAAILKSLVKDDGRCMMFECFKNDFEIDAQQTKLVI